MDKSKQECMQEHTLIQSKKIVESAPFDQVICSLHLLDGKDLKYTL